jgi:hypothetical protein
MFHFIEFRTDAHLDLILSRPRRLERLLVHPGLRLYTRVRPYVTESADGPVEVADLELDDGTTLRAVPFASFRFVEGPA